MQRRDFAKLLGLSAASALLPSSRGARTARAQQVTIPKRVVFVYLSDGLLWGDGEVKPPSGASNYTSTSFALPTCLAPLASFRNDMLLFDNLDMVSATVDPTAPANAHFAGETHALTATNRLTDSLAGGASIDQFIAQQIHAGGQLTALKSLEIFCSPEMAYNDGFKGPRKIASTSGPGQQVDALGRPEDVYDRVFGTPAGDPGETSAALARQQRIFDFLRGQHGAAGKLLPKEDREKLDQHMQLLSDIEASRKLLLAASDRRVFWPDPSVIAPAAGLDWTYNAARDTTWYERYRLAVPINLKLAAAALHADLTRVVTIALDEPPPEGLGFSDGMYGATDYHDLTHKTNDTTGQSSQASDAAARGEVIKVLQGAMDQVRLLAEELAGLQEVDGSRLLDHTLVVFTSQIGHGDHALERLPWFTLGNIDGYFKTGRVIMSQRSVDPLATWRTNGRPHNDLFVSVANAMGVAIDSFGNPDVCTGPIREMRP